MITLQHIHYEIHDEVSKNDKVHNGFIKLFKGTVELISRGGEVCTYNSNLFYKSDDWNHHDL